MRPLIKLFSYFLVLGFFLSSLSQEINFSKTKIKVSSQTLHVELAKTDAEQMRGLMFRRVLKDDEGMLFVYTDEDIRSFWMKNTFIPLSIGFFDAKGRLIDIQDMQPVKSTIQVQLPSYTSKGKAKYALEVNQGWFQKHKIKLGETLTFLNEKK